MATGKGNEGMIRGVVRSASNVIVRSATIEGAVNRNGLSKVRSRAEEGNNEQRDQNEHVCLHDERMRSNENKISHRWRKRVWVAVNVVS
jgi:hypothetical protein